MAANMTSVSKKGAGNKVQSAKEEKKEAEEQYLLESVPTSGDGNCAFNAFALGLAEGVLANRIICPPDFYTISPISSLKISDPESFKEWLRNHTSLEWQQTLQGMLRKIAVKSIKKEYGTLYDYHAMLVSARDNPSQDDTFRYHEPIQKKMEEVRVKRDKEKQALEGALSSLTEFLKAANVDLDETQKAKIIKSYKERLANLDKHYDKELCTWFDATGKTIFFEALEQSASGAGDRARWGSEVELAALARYFSINIRWKKGPISSAEGRIIGVGNGRILGLSEPEKKELRDLGLGDKEGTYFTIRVLEASSFNEMDSTASETFARYIEEQSEIELPDILEGEKITKEALERLNKYEMLNGNKILLYKNIPLEIDNQKNKINQAIVEFIKKARQEKSRKVPSEIAEVHRRWLRDRGIITTTRELEGSNNCPNKGVILRKLKKIPGALKKKLEENFNSSSVIFEVGNSGSHWTYYRITKKIKQNLDVPIKQVQQSMPVPPVVPKKHDNKWHVKEFNQFLTSQFVPDKAVKVDCKFEKIDLKALKEELLGIKLYLIKRSEKNLEKDAGVLFVRSLGNTLTIFYCGIEFFSDKDESKSKKQIKLKRCVLKVFSSSFAEDRESTLRGKWKSLMPEIKNKEKSEKESLDILEKLAAEDFLKGSDRDGMTRFDCYTIPNTTEYSHTGLLYKTLKTLELESEEVDWSNKEASTNLHEKYKIRAGQFLVKDPSVAKAQQGFCYQEHLMMLIAYLATINPPEIDFSIIAEASVPEAWNDIVFEWNGELIFFQQKHRSSYSTSTAKMYSTSEILAKKGADKEDASLLKYYTAYQKLIKRIKNPSDPLHRYRDKLKKNKIKFIFFTNKTLPLEPIEGEPGKFNLKKMKGRNGSQKIDFIQFGTADRSKIPLIDLAGFQEIIGGRPVYQVASCDAAQLATCVKEGELAKDQDNLNKFFASFYLFSDQMNAADLFLHCKKTMKTPLSGKIPLGGFGQAFLADTFAHYIHRAFVAENPTHPVLNRTVITDFFNKHEYYHYNLVKYSCYNYPENQLNQLLAHPSNALSELACLKKIQEGREQQVTIYCAEPSVGLAVIQSLFPAGERQILTPFSPNLSDYAVDSRFKYIIILGEENEFSSVIKKITENPTIRIIQICAIEKSRPRESTLQVKANQLHFLKEAYPSISILGDIDICLTDLLLFGVTKLTGGLSEEASVKYVPHTPTEEGIVLPYDKLEKELIKWINNHQDAVDLSWFKIEDHEKYEYRVYIDLPEILHGKEINRPSNKKFVLDEKNKRMYYVHKGVERELIKFPGKPLSKPIDFASLAAEIKKWGEEKLRFPKDVPKVKQCIYVKLAEPYDGPLPNKTQWSILKDKKFIFYYPFRELQQCSINLSDIPFSDSTVTVIEAEAACGKTWFLRSQINEAMLKPGEKVPLFIRLKDLEKVRDIEKSIPEMLAYAALPSHIIRIAEREPQYFHLLLDGFDELLKEFLPQFERFLNQLIQQGYSVTVTVRDYQIEKLQKQTSHIIVQQRLEQFDDEQKKDCLKKALKGTIAIEDKALDEEIERLLSALNAQASVNEWLGIPLHVALLSEWYLYNRNSLTSNEMNPSVSEIYNFILRSRIERHTTRNRSDLYKLLYKTAIIQIFSKRKEFNIFPTKDYKLKNELQFDLERTGLLRDPFSDSPELFHRTFAEFLIAKRWCRKIIRNSERGTDNFQLIQRLYQTENRLICHFFIGLYETQDTDPDVPYELSEDQKTTFINKWLTDINGKKLVELQIPKDRKDKLVTWKKAEKTDEAEKESKNKQESIVIGNKKVPGCITEISAIKEIAELAPKSFDKDPSRDYLMKCFEIYQNTQNPDILKELQKVIRAINMRCFLRADYPKEGTPLLERYQNIDEFNITAVREVFNHLKKISAKYHWYSNRNSYAFVCWSQGGYRDNDFAMPLLEEIGPHINIIHVFYMCLYVEYGGYSKKNKNTLTSTAITHLEEFNVKTASLPAVFCSVLLFLGLIENWSSSNKQEHPTLPLLVAEKMTKAFERLLNEPGISRETTLFFQVLLVDFMLFFQIRGYAIGVNEAESQGVKLISPDGFQGTLALPHPEKERIATHQAIALQFDRQKTGIERFEHFFTVWDTVLLNLRRAGNISFTDTVALDKTSTPMADETPLSTLAASVSLAATTIEVPATVVSPPPTSRKKSRSPGTQAAGSPLLFSLAAPSSTNTIVSSAASASSHVTATAVTTTEQEEDASRRNSELSSKKARILAKSS